MLKGYWRYKTQMSTSGLWLTLTLSEREEIRASLSAKMSIRAIATALKSSFDVSREVQRNRAGAITNCRY